MKSQGEEVVRMLSHDAFYPGTCDQRAKGINKWKRLLNFMKVKLLNSLCH